MTAAEPAGAAPARRRILFVDDEPHLLSGLRRMLRGHRDEWDMSFAEGGEAALELMAAAPVDVVVSDMRMPGMDGGRLLALVRERHPRTARIILSGHADRSAIVTAVGPTQQFLAKPCEVDELVAVLQRVLAVRDLVDDGALRDLLGGVGSLPKPPEVHREILALSADPGWRMADVARVVERDVATTAEVLRLVNSAFFGFPTRVESIDRAVGLLGLEVIHALATAGAVFAAGGPPPPGLDLAEVSARGARTGLLCRRLAELEGWDREACGAVFFAGMLHEVALPVLVSRDPAAWRLLRRAPGTDPQSAEDAERRALGCSVTRAGAYLLGMWGFPEPVVVAVAGQPAPPGDPGTVPVARLLDHARRVVRFPHAPSTADGGYLTAERLHRWLRAGGEEPEAPDHPPAVVGRAGGDRGGSQGVDTESDFGAV